MHNAPPVVYPVGRFVWGAWISGVIAAVGAAALWVWQVLALPDSLHIGAAWAVWSASLFGAVLSWPTEGAGPGCLVWTGEVWLWQDASGAETPVHVQVVLDAGRFMALSCAGAQKGVCVGQRVQFALLRRASMPSFWHGFRCAVYSCSMGDPLSKHRQTSRFEM
jgi:hypothetical protein